MTQRPRCRPRCSATTFADDPSACIWSEDQIPSTLLVEDVNSEWELHFVVNRVYGLPI